jgi:hypothetical protein
MKQTQVQPQRRWWRITRSQQKQGTRKVSVPLDDWFTFSPDYVRGMKQKLRTSRNKISMQIPVTGAQCTIVWAICDGNAPYWRTYPFLMGHIKF